MNEIDKLYEGFHRFRRQYFERERELFERLANKGQSPKVVLIACCDARVDPAIVTDAEPGDLFVVRNVANLVPPCERGGMHHGTSAALEFAVKDLGVEHIVVMGHARCGGIGALMRPPTHRDSPRDFIDAWMSIAGGVREQVFKEFGEASADARQRAAEQRSILVSLDNLLSFPWIREKVEAGTLHLHGWYFDLGEGILYRYDPAAGGFCPLIDSGPAKDGQPCSTA